MSRAPAHSSNSPHSGRKYALARLCIDARRSETQGGLRAGAPSADGFVALSRNASRSISAVWKSFGIELRLFFCSLSSALPPLLCLE
jgi:hypothetical protein